MSDHQADQDREAMAVFYRIADALEAIQRLLYARNVADGVSPGPIPEGVHNDIDDNQPAGRE